MHMTIDDQIKDEKLKYDINLLILLWERLLKRKTSVLKSLNISDKKVN